MLLEALDTAGLWSIARGLARNVDKYKQNLAACDLQRRNDLDGRGALSEEALAKFSQFFLEMCLDQVDFMQKLMEPSSLRKRIIEWAKEEKQLGTLLDGSIRVLGHILTHRELERKDVRDVTGFSADKSRRVTAALHKRGIITADTHKAPFRIVFPADIVVRMMPELYPKFPQRPDSINHQ